MSHFKIDAYRASREADRLLLAGHFKQASVLYSRAIKFGRLLSSELSSQYYRLGSCLYCQQKYELALKRYKKAAKLNKSLHNSYNGIGSCLSNLGRYEEAIEYFKIATSSSAYYALAYINWALALYLQGKEKGALEISEKIRNCYFDSNKRDTVLEVYKDEITFANERIAHSTNEDERNLAQERLKGVQYMINLIKKY